MRPLPFTAQVISNEYIAQETRKTVFEIQDFKASSFSFRSGQFVNLVLRDAEKKTVMRAYSIASSPSLLPRFELCVKVLKNGLGSGFIDRLQKGDTVSFIGPFGHFGQKYPEKKILMVATGTGIAPMKAIIDDISEKGFLQKTTLVFGVREQSYASYMEYFKKIEKKYNNFTFILYVSRPSSEYLGKRGRVTKFFEEKSSEYFLDTEIIICGNPSMVKEVKTLLQKEKSVDKKHICVEAY